MSDQRNSGIAWTDQTWNPVRGCSRVSDGCMNCYAESMAACFCGPGQPYEGTINLDTKRWNGKIKLVHEHLTDPLRWKFPRRIFVNSMSDLFHEGVPDEFIDQVFAMMARCPQHIFQVLTKRPKRMLNYLSPRCEILFPTYERIKKLALYNVMEWPLPNIHLGVTVENQQAADERITLLLQMPAAVRWISMEPLLGAVDLRFTNGLVHGCDAADYLLDWVVCGGESGRNARPAHPGWIRSLRDQCRDAGVPFMFKQWGEHDHRMIRMGKKAAGRLLDGVLHDEYPHEVRT